LLGSINAVLWRHRRWVLLCIYDCSGHKQFEPIPVNGWPNDANVCAQLVKAKFQEYFRHIFYNQPTADVPKQRQLKGLGAKCSKLASSSSFSGHLIKCINKWRARLDGWRGRIHKIRSARDPWSQCQYRQAYPKGYCLTNWINVDAWPDTTDLLASCSVRFSGRIPDSILFLPHRIQSNKGHKYMHYVL